MKDFLNRLMQMINTSIISQARCFLNRRPKAAIKRQTIYKYGKNKPIKAAGQNFLGSICGDHQLRSNKTPARIALNVPALRIILPKYAALNIFISLPDPGSFVLLT